MEVPGGELPCEHLLTAVLANSPFKPSTSELYGDACPVPAREPDAADGVLAGDHPPMQTDAAGIGLAQDHSSVPGCKPDAADGGQAPALKTEELVEDPGQFRDTSSALRRN